MQRVPLYAFTLKISALFLQRVQSVLQGFLSGIQQQGAALRARWVAGGGAPAAAELAVGHACGAPALIGETAPNVWRGSLPPELAVMEVRAAASTGEVTAGSKHPGRNFTLIFGLRGRNLNGMPHSKLSKSDQLCHDQDKLLSSTFNTAK